MERLMVKSVSLFKNKTNNQPTNQPQKALLCSSEMGLNLKNDTYEIS